jgi:two-component system, OmpR family, sensor histidine kinase KdpD
VIRALVPGLLGLAAVTLLLVQLRSATQAAVGTVHVALLYLLVLLVASARAGRAAGIVLSAIAFLALNFFFIPPYHTLAIGNPFDWLVLVAFFITAFTAAELLSRAREQASLRDAARAKDETLAAVSHDLRTPLTSIRALAHQIAADGDVRALMIEEEAERLGRFVGDLLDLSQLRAGGLRIAPDINAVDDLIGAALQRVSGMTSDRVIEARVDAGEAVLAGRFDFTHALRVVGNLLENAIKYSPAATVVECTARREGPWILVSVADRGPGLPSHEVAHVFEAFYRPETAAPDRGSRGLGLAIARELAEAQGGRLEYVARTGGGSIFVLHLQAVDLTTEFGAL